MNMKDRTESKYRILIFAAAAGLLAMLVSGFADDRAGTVLYRENSTRYEISFQTEAGTQLVAYLGEQEQNAHISASDAGTAEYTVNINTADEDELDRLLPGIGEKKAAAIVEYRSNIGGFRSVEELIEIEGIGPALLERIRPYCTVSDTDAP